MTRPAARVAALVLVLLVPVAIAHVDAPRHSIQETEPRRGVIATVSGTNATFELVLVRDPLEHLVLYHLDPTASWFSGEYRFAASDADGAFRAAWRPLRFVEYKDANRDGVFQPDVDAVVRSWAWRDFAWNVTEPRRVVVGDATAQDVLWQGRHAGGLHLDVEAVASGAAFTDEGARVREQDALVYVTLSGLPPRNTGNLHALDGVLVPPGGARVGLDKAENLSRAVLVQSPGRLGVLDHGGEAVLDGEEREIAVTVGEPGEGGARPWRLHFPRLDESVRLVLVLATEYAPPERRAPDAGAALLLAAAAAVALSAGRLTRAR